MKKLVVLASRSPLPLQKGDKLRLYHQLRFLSRHFTIYLIALQQEVSSDDQQTDLESMCKEVHLLTIGKWKSLARAIIGGLSGYPITVAYFYSPVLDRRIRELIEEIQPHHIYCQLIRMAPYAEGIQIPKSIDYMDSFSLRAQRLGAKKLALARLFWRHEEERLRRYERQVQRWFLHHFIISKIDQNEVSLAGRIAPTILQNGVDAKYFSRQKFSGPREKTLVFVGNLSYHPNVLAAQYLVKEIAPGLWNIDEDIRIVIAGADPRRSVLRLASNRVEVLGFVEDIRHVYAMGSLFVAPIFTGSGLQNKILEALAMECLCITTSIVRDSIPHSSDVVKIADTAGDFVHNILRLLSSPKECETITTQGRKMVLDHYHWEKACEPLLDLLD